MSSPPTSTEAEPFYIGDHYLYDGFWYYTKFPVVWAKTHLPGTGPLECSSCVLHGTVHEGTVFLGYCANCALYEYHLNRGHGFVGGGQEQSLPPSAYQTYLKGGRPSDVPPLLCDVSPPPSPDAAIENAPEDDTGLGETSILQCHYEGGYNDY